MRKRSAVALILALAGACGLTGSAEPISLAEHRQSYAWSEPAKTFGGFSGLEIAPDGVQFTALSDRGQLMQGRLLRKDGKIIGVQAGPLAPLLDSAGAVPVIWLRDSEGLAEGPDGTLYIAYERKARIWAHDPVTRTARALPRSPAFDALQSNSSLEALAIDSSGHLFTLPERSGAVRRPFPVYRFDGRTWDQPFSIPRSEGFLPVGADFGPDGWLYLLERAFNGFGFRSRVRRFDVTGGQVRAEETLFSTHTGRHDNLEALAVWQDGPDSLRLTMLSDDNFRFYQRTEFVEYSVPLPGLAKAALNP